MKKFFALAIVALALTACGKDTDDTGKPVEKVALETPTLTVSNQTENGFTISWNAVENAVGYTYIMTEQATTTETSVTFSDLQPGSYTVRVQANAAADSKEYKDSQFADITVTITAPVPDVWFEQDMYVTDEYADQGLTSYNSIFIEWIGQDVIEVKFLVIPTDGLEGMSGEEAWEGYSDVFQTLDAEGLEYVNSDGCLIYLDECTSNTSYSVIAHATHVSGETTLLTDEVTTAEFEVDDTVASWFGDWTLTASEALKLSVGSDGYLAMDFVAHDFSVPVTISASTVDPNQVLIYGWSQLDASLPAVGVVAEDGSLDVYTGVALDGADEEGYAPTWLVYGDYEGGSTFVSGQFPAYSFVKDQYVAEGVGQTVELNGGYHFTVRSMEVYSFNEATGQLSPYANEEDFPLFYLGGDITLTSADVDGAPRAAKMFTGKAKAQIASRASVVSTDVVAF